MARRLSGHQRALIAACRDAGLPVPVPELEFHPTRKWRLDLAWPDHKVAIEIEGGAFRRKGQAFRGGRHTSGGGFKEDLVKYGEAFMRGWRVLRVMPEHVTKGHALAWLRPVLTAPTDPVSPERSVSAP